MSLVSPSVNDPQDRPDLVEIHNCVAETLASLDVEGVEFFLELDGETLKLTLQTNKFLEAQDLAVELGKKIEQITAADIHQLGVYKRKSAETNAFLIKEMALGKVELPEPKTETETEVAEIPVSNPSPRKISSKALKDKSEFNYRPNFRAYGLLNSYLLRTVSGFSALGIGIAVVWGISNLFGSMEQKPLTYIDVNQLPGLGTIQNDPEVMVYHVKFPRRTHTSRLVVFLPTHPAKPKLPCIFVAPSATAPLYGQTIDEETMVYGNYINYAKAGYAVVAHDVDGYIDEVDRISDPPSAMVIDSLKAYKASDAGVLNAKLAIDYAVARIPQIDPNAMYVAGSGSGGTIALMVAATDPRIKAAIAYSPITNLPGKHAALVETISKSVPGYKEFIDRSSPHHQIDKMKKPLFIFHNDRSTETSLADTTSFVESVQKNNPLVSFTHGQNEGLPSGDYLPNIKQAIEWLNSQQKN
jgi:dienelactone hydrolase